MRIALLYGGRSGEHEISIRSARSIHTVLKQTHSVFPVFIDKQGHWWRTTPAESLPVSADGLQDKICVFPGVTAQASLFTRDSRLEIDIAFPVLHGTHGEDGIIQGLLESAGIPYVGAGVAASAAGMDKALMKALFAQNNVPIPPFVWFNRSRWTKSQQECLQEIESSFGYPVFVKPANLGSSVGVGKAANREALKSAISDAARYDSKIIVEQGIDAREIECSVLGNEEPQASLAGEIVPKREFYDYVAKYVEDTTELHIPANLSDAQMREARELSVRAFKTIDCRGMGRVDLLLDRNTGKFYVNEINTIPGFTTISMYPKLWEVSGLPYPELLDRLLQLGLERHRDQLQNITSYDVIQNP